MNAEKTSALVPALVTLAYLAPQLAPGTPPEGAFSWLCSGMVQSASQALFLFVIIGLSGALPEFGAGRPRSADILRALGLFALLAAAGLGANGLWRATFADPAAKAIMPALESQPWASAALPAAIMGFSLAVGYREELFYRCYAIGSMVRLGARPAQIGRAHV